MRSADSTAAAIHSSRLNTLGAPKHNLFSRLNEKVSGWMQRTGVSKPHIPRISSKPKLTLPEAQLHAEELHLVKKATRNAAIKILEELNIVHVTEPQLESRNRLPVETQRKMDKQLATLRDVAVHEHFGHESFDDFVQTVYTQVTKPEAEQQSIDEPGVFVLNRQKIHERLFPLLTEMMESREDLGVLLQKEKQIK